MRSLTVCRRTNIERHTRVHGLGSHCGWVYDPNLVECIRAFYRRWACADALARIAHVKRPNLAQPDHSRAALSAVRWRPVSFVR
jgi:hypothetical protein